MPPFGLEANAVADSEFLGMGEIAFAPVGPIRPCAPVGPAAPVEPYFSTLYVDQLRASVGMHGKLSNVWYRSGAEEFGFDPVCTDFA